MALTTCLWFDGNGREAAEFYVANFPDSSLGRNWVAPTETPSNEEGSEVVVDFTIFGMSFIALNGGPMFKFNEAVSFVIPCSDQAEIDHYWELLIRDGGKPSQCGWLKDKFGVSWQVTSREMEEYIGGSDPDGAKGATEAMMAMTKIDLDELRRAYQSAAAQ
jgi:predicted 3-demethylubiquinone-9 3-methyltransferase (glyoxalase superfamily)